MPVFFTIYYLAPARFSNLVLFAGSIVFYAWGEPKYTILVLLSVLVNYFLAGRLARYPSGSLPRRLLFVLAVIYNVGMLGVFKYSGFAVANWNAITGSSLKIPEIGLPLGISFYTFQILSYVIDVYREEVEPETSIIDLGTYLVMFPQLIAGPIVVYSSVAERLKRRTIRLTSVENGLKTFTLGLGSKVILANSLGNIWNACGEAGYGNLSTPMSWVGIAAYTLQLYFDFSGYSLMAIGLGEMLGFHFPRNFKYPYTANTVTDFWRRWHITLTSWFRNYVYIPLGGNRKGAARTFLNMFIIWLITGLWHGASWNFVVWGLYYFVILTLERLFLKDLLDHLQILSRIYTLLVVMCGWVLFAVPSLSEAMVYFSRMFTWHPGTDYLEFLPGYLIFFIPAVLFSTPIFTRYYYRHKRGAIVLLALLAIFWGSVVLLVDSVYNPFLYFRF